MHCFVDSEIRSFQNPSTGQWVADTGRQILTDILLLGDKDPKDFLVGYEDMMNFLQDPSNWVSIEKELEQRNVKAMTFYDVVLDFIILDAFKDLDSPPNSVTAVVQNRFLSNGFKETVISKLIEKCPLLNMQYFVGFVCFLGANNSCVVSVKSQTSYA